MTYNPRKDGRHPVCRQFDLILESILVHQDTGNSNVGEAMRHEFGESLTASIMQAAGIRRLRREIDARTKSGTQPTTIAPTPE